MLVYRSDSAPQANVALSGNRVSAGFGEGIKIANSSLTQQVSGILANGNLIANTGGTGVLVRASLTANNNVVIRGNAIVGNATGVSFTGAANGFIVNAANNWWGDASGPGGAGPGTGDTVSTDVAYDPWLMELP